MRTPTSPTLLVILLCFVYYCSHIHIVSGLCLVDQRSLLLQLKNTLIFEPEDSSKLKTWNQSIACCQWSGVTCDNKGHVTGLDLSGESISGGFDNASSLFSLQHLQILHLGTNNFSSVIPSGFSKLDKLTYLNLSYAGFVGQIPVEISKLTRLVTLDFSSLSFLTGQKSLKLENPNLQKLLQNLTSIRRLYLDGVSISAHGEEWSNALLLRPNLHELSMSHCNLSGPLESNLIRLENLSVIHLDQNNLSSPVPETFANFKNLTKLSFGYCGLKGTFPPKIFKIAALSVVDISNNFNLHGSFPDFPLNGSLRTLIVSKTSFSGALPLSIGNMVKLSKLDLSNCQFNGTLPSSLSNNTELNYLDLSFNNFTGPIPSFGIAKNIIHIDLSENNLSGAIPSSSHFQELQNLISIDLSNNSINGTIPSSFFTLPSLQRIQLSNNQFSQLDSFTSVSSSLNTLDLSYNKLSGPIPASIFQLSGLSILLLSSNKFNGSLLFNKLLELRNLTTLDLSYNNLSIDVNGTEVDLYSFPNITTLKLASCNLKTFPGFLRYQHKLTILDLSENQIQGIVPNWIWKLQSLGSLNISYNLLTDLEGPLQTASRLVVLDVHYNRLRGPTPIFPQFAVYLDYSSNQFSSAIPVEIGNYLSSTIFFSLSNNSFIGIIPDSLCNASNLQVLDLSHNNISGVIPSCLMTMGLTLGVLNLRMNNIRGPIPDTFPASCALRTLDLRANKLDGHIPKSLANCTTLEVLDLGNNRISDGFPCLLKTITTLRVLVLQKNKFHGPIGCQKTNDTWQMLQIVDLALNNFSGELPGKCFTRWEAMIPDEDQAESEIMHIQFQVLQYRQVYYHDSVTVTIKGQQMELVKILNVFTSIDLSSNHFQGPIPEELMRFKALYMLNLSNNALTGQIPSYIGNLTQLESLDLSKNSLEGTIPTQLATLYFLSFMDLSFNNLEGEIPIGTQIQTFDATSFIGNKGLCGAPLVTKCEADGSVSPPEVQMTESVNECDWLVVSTGVGFGVGAGLVVAPLMIWERGRKWSNNSIDKFLLVVLPMCGLAYTPIGDDDDEGDDTEEKDSYMTEDYDSNEEEDNWGYPRFRGRYCVFCSKLDITKKRVIHDPRCTCYHSPTVSASTSSEVSYSP